MRRISFALTQQPYQDGTKTVTRRLGWLTLQPGTHLMGVDKIMGFPKGHRGGGKALGELVVLDVRRERLDAITDDEVIREGFPGRDSAWFVAMFCREMRRAKPDTMVTRIEFKRVAGGGLATWPLCGCNRDNGAPCLSRSIYVDDVGIGFCDEHRLEALAGITTIATSIDDFDRWWTASGFGAEAGDARWSGLEYGEWPEGEQP